jgi:hypothetical protein
LEGPLAEARDCLEEFMPTYHSEFARRYFSQGEAPRRAEGEASGEAKGPANALLLVLDVRRLHVTDEVRAKIAACTDIHQLDNWIDRAATARTIEDLQFPDS